LENKLQCELQAAEQHFQVMVQLYNRFIKMFTNVHLC